MRRSRAGWLSRTTLPGIIIAVILGLVGPSTWTPDGPAGARTADPSGRTSGDSAGMSITAAEVGLTAPLDPIRFEGSTLEPPEQVNRAGWWADGAELAADGDRPSVITGHVSDGRDTPGAFAAVRRLKPDMTVTTHDEQGHDRRWRVVSVRRFSKDKLPRSLFLAGPRRVLRLITCTSRVVNVQGRFHYAENLVVDLVPVDAA